MNPDFIDFLRELVAAKTRFLIVGAHALAYHGVPRATQDLDVLVDPSPSNAKCVWRALAAFGAPVSDMAVTLEDFSRPATVVQLGLPPRRIDLLTEITGVTFADAWQTRVEHEVEGLRIPILGREALIANKRATGRRKDAVDLEALGEQLP